MSIGLLLVGLVVARQAVALREYRRLVQLQRSALVSSVSHELRTPLTALVGFLDVLKDPRVFLDSKERTELTEVVHQQAVYMSRIVADLLLLARSSSGLQLRETEVHVGQAHRRHPQVDSGKPGRHRGRGRPGLVAFLDGDRLQQVVANLVVNASQVWRGTGPGHRFIGRRQTWSSRFTTTATAFPASTSWRSGSNSSGASTG